MIRVYLIEDQTILRASFRSLLNEMGPFTVVGDSGDARQALEEVPTLRPDVILLDITMPGLSGIDAIPMLRKRIPRAKLVILTHQEGETFLDQALRAGVDGYLTKDSEPAELKLALEAVSRGDAFISPRVASSVLARASGQIPSQDEPMTRLSSLTAREREVFQLLALGRANKEIAQQLGISLGTVKKHRENLQRKLDCHSAAELARLAIREGLINP